MRVDQRVGFRSLRRDGRGGNMNHVGMKLPQRDQRHFARAKRRHEFRAVRRDALALIPIREAQIQRALAVQHALASGPRAESMHQPAEFSQRARLHDLQAARAADRPAALTARGAARSSRVTGPRLDDRVFIARAIRCRVPYSPL